MLLGSSRHLGASMVTVSNYSRASFLACVRPAVMGFQPLKRLVEPGVLMHVILIVPTWICIFFHTAAPDEK